MVNVDFDPEINQSSQGFAVSLWVTFYNLFVIIANKKIISLKKMKIGK